MDNIRSEYIYQRDSAVGSVWIQHERHERDGMDMYGGKMMGILGEG